MVMKTKFAADRVPFRRLSNPFPAATMDLQARVDSAAAAASLPRALWESDETLSICTTAGGTWNAVAIWFEVRAEEAGSAGMFKVEKSSSWVHVQQSSHRGNAHSLCISSTICPATEAKKLMQTVLACRWTCAQACA